MIEIIRISSADEGGAVLVECTLTGDDIIVKDGKVCKRKAFLLLPEHYSELKPEKGAVNSETAEILADYDAKSHAVIAGRRLLGYASNSSKQIALKLMRKGFSSAAARYAGEKLLEEGEIDEKTDAVRQAEKLASSGKGKQRIIMQLRAKSYGTEAINAASDYLDTLDFSDICAAVIRKKYGKLPVDTDERRKCIASLMRLGFSTKDIREAVKRI